MPVPCSSLRERYKLCDLWYYLWTQHCYSTKSNRWAKQRVKLNRCRYPAFTHRAQRQHRLYIDPPLQRCRSVVVLRILTLGQWEAWRHPSRLRQLLRFSSALSCLSPCPAKRATTMSQGCDPRISSSGATLLRCEKFARLHSSSSFFAACVHDIKRFFFVPVDD